MRLLVVDGINETHVVDSFLAAAREREILTVAETGRVWRAPTFPNVQEAASIWALLEEHVSSGVDVVFNFRASSLTPEMLEWLKLKGVFTVVWLPDDPVFFKTCYLAVTPNYDLVLNCGNVRVIEYYEKELAVRGWNYPFWTGFDTFSETSVEKRHDAVFLGGLSGKVREGRSAVLRDLPIAVRQYGQPSSIAPHLNAGYLASTREIADAISAAHVAINIPQRFSDYLDTPFYFSDMNWLAEFEMPSRVVQYAACGVPVVSWSRFSIPGLPSILCADSPEELGRLIRQLLADDDRRVDLGKQIKLQFERNFTAHSRIDFLLNLVNGSAQAGGSVQERHTKFLEF